MRPVVPNFGPGAVTIITLVGRVAGPQKLEEQRLADGRRSNLKTISTLACCFGLLACMPACANEIHSIDVDAVKRSYVLHVPADVGPGAALVVVLHGRGSSGAEEIARGHWQSKADKEKFIVAAPDALDSYVGVEHKKTPAIRDWITRNYQALLGHNVVRWHGGRNDVKLIESVIDRVSVERRIDPSRIYIVGYSRGGFMAHRMAMEIADRLAGVAVVSPDVEPGPAKVPARPLSFLLVSGDQDPFHPVSSDRPAATMERWRVADHCPSLSDVDLRSAGLTAEGAGPCAEGTEIRYVIAHGVTHDWTEAPTTYSDISWAFLSRFRRQPAASQ